MDFITPKCKNTIYSSDYLEWIPASFEDFLLELKHVKNSCEGTDPVCLFRGQINHKWFLDSSFVRNGIKKLFEISDYRALPSEIRNTSIFNKTMLSLLLLKLNILMKPKEELFKKEQDGDSWFEFLKHLQQYPCKYPEDQKFIPGTFFLDWSLSEDIGLYFSIFNGKETQFDDNFNSALWIFDAGSVGKIQQISKTSKIIDLMCSQKFRNGDEGFPLLFYPEKQITNNIKIKNQLI